MAMLSGIDLFEPLYCIAADPGPGVQDDSEKDQAGIVMTAGIAVASQLDEPFGQMNRFQAVLSTWR